MRGKLPFCISSRYVHYWSHLPTCVCPDNMFWMAQPFVTELGVVVHCHEPECHAMTGLPSFRARTQIKQNITFLLYLLDCWSFSKLFGCMWSKARMSWIFRVKITVSKNACPDDSFWTAKTFATKFSMVMYHHEPVACKKFILLSSRSQWRLI